MLHVLYSLFYILLTPNQWDKVAPWNDNCSTSCSVSYSQPYSVIEKGIAGNKPENWGSYIGFRKNIFNVANSTNLISPLE